MKLVCCVLLDHIRVYTTGETGNQTKKVNYQNNNLSLLVNSYFLMHKHVIYREEKRFKE